MEKTPRDFIFDNLLSMSAYWACTGAIIASLTAYYGFSLALSNVVTGLSGTAGGRPCLRAHNTSAALSAPV